MLKPLLELTCSKTFIIILIFLYFIAMFCIAYSHAPLVLQLLLIGLCAISFIMTLRRDAMLSSPKSILQAKAIEGQQWKIMQKNGQQHVVRLLGKSVCTPYLVILNFKITPQIFNNQQMANSNHNKNRSQIIGAKARIDQFNGDQIKNDLLNGNQKLIDSISGESFFRDQMMTLIEKNEDADLKNARSYRDRVKNSITKIYRTHQDKLSVLVFPDSVDTNSFRQLRAYLQAVRGGLK